MTSDSPTNPPRMTRRGVAKLAGASTFALTWFRDLAAEEASPAASPAVEGMSPSPIEGVPNAYWQYPEPTTTVDAAPGSGGEVSVLLLTDKQIPDRDDNQYWQELESRLGVTLNMTFLPGAAYAERMAATFAGGDYPDLMNVYTLLYPQVSEFTVQGAFLDLTDYLDDAGRAAFPNLNQLPAYAYQNSRLNGRLYGVPNPTSLQPNGLWFREDWRAALDLPVPTDVTSFQAMLEAFTTGDPDGNGSPDTFGNASDSVNPFETRFVHAMFRVPAEGDGFGFAVQPDGTFVNEIETPEFRTALEYMREMWASGAMHPDSLTDTSGDIREKFIGGQVGSISNAFILLSFMRTELPKVVPTGQVMGLVPPPFDGTGNPVTYNIAGYFGQWSIPTAVNADEARTEELLRLTDYFAAPFGSEEYIFLNFGIEGVHHTLNDDGSRTLTALGETEVFSMSLGGLNVLYDPDRELITYVQSLMAEQTTHGVTDPTFNLYSQTAAEMKGEFQQMYFDNKIAIGSGREPMSALDTWIADWRSRGGEQILAEHEEAYAQAQAQ